MVPPERGSASDHGHPDPSSDPSPGHSPEGYEEYVAPGSLEAAIGSLADPLNDPLPGQRPGHRLSEGHRPPEGHRAEQRQAAERTGPEQREQTSRAAPESGETGSESPPQRSGPSWSQPYAAASYPSAPEEGASGGGPAAAAADPAAPRTAREYHDPARPPERQQPATEETLSLARVRASASPPATDDETMTLRAAFGPSAPHPTPHQAAQQTPQPSGVPAPPGRQRSRRAQHSGPGHRPQQEAPAAGGRAARRRALKAAKPGPGVIASRVIGELFITCGVLMLLFVTYQLWWTNVLADQHASGTTDNLHEKWDSAPSDSDVDERDPGTFSAGEGFAVLYIPRLDVKAPVAEGIDKHKVLDKGLLGHYADKPVATAMPWEETGNFAIAGHRNTHGEPFRYINKLDPGDPIVVETKDTFYTYEMTNRLDSTAPSNISVIEPVPPESGFTEPGRYITLTTCTPEFTSKYRLIVWGRLVDERPRSEGKPDALID